MKKRIGWMCEVKIFLSVSNMQVFSYFMVNYLFKSIGLI